MDKKYSWRAWVVVVSGALFFFYEFLKMSMLNAISFGLMRDFSLSSTQLAFLSTTFLFATIAFLLPSGIMLDRFGPRKILLTTLAVSIVGTIIFSFTSSILVAGFAHFLDGIGDAFSFLICVTLIARWFPSTKMGLAMGIVLPIGLWGGIVAQTPLTLLNGLFGWRGTLLVVAGIGFIIWCNAWFFVYDRPEKNIEEKLPEFKLFHYLKLLVKNRQNWLGGIFTGLLNLPIMIFDSLYGNLYLQQYYHFKSTQASYINTMIFLGTIIGAPLLGWFSDKIYSRRAPMFLGALFSVFLVLIIIKSHHLSFKELIVLFFLLGLTTSAQVLSYTAIVENNPLHLASSANGFASIFIMGCAALAQPLFGWLMKWHWNGSIMNGVPYFSQHDYRLALTLLPVRFVLALFAVCFMRETHCQQFRSLP